MVDVFGGRSQHSILGNERMMERFSCEQALSLLNSTYYHRVLIDRYLGVTGWFYEVLSLLIGRLLLVSLSCL